MIKLVKPFVLFMALFWITLVLVYSQPIIFLQKFNENGIDTKNNSINNLARLTPSNKAAPVSFAKYIGGSELQFRNILVDNNVFWKSSKGKIISIEVKKNTLALRPFSIGQTLVELAQKYSLETSFKLNLKKKKYVLELDDGELNYRVLFSFTNGSYAILDFSKDSIKLEGVNFLAAQELFDKGVYNWVEAR